MLVTLSLYSHHTSSLPSKSRLFTVDAFLLPIANIDLSVEKCLALNRKFCFPFDRQHSLTDFKSGLIAEQMTLLDAALFQKIEVPCPSDTTVHCGFFLVR